MLSRGTERAIVLVVAAAQFINVLEFVIVMPLGPDYAAALHVPTSQLPYIASAYTAAAAVAGLIGAFVLDRYDRRQVLSLALAGLVLSTACAGLAPTFHTLIVARAMAGFFGGPATSVAMSIVADAVPSERRGHAFATVLMAFSLASILGVPAGLELARFAGWRAPFFAIAALGFVAVAVTRSLPPLVSHIAAARTMAPGRGLLTILAAPIVLRSYAMTFALQMSGFLVIPNISAYLQLNIGFPRAYLGLLYLVGGAVSLGSTRLAGRLVDRHGSLRTGGLGLALIAPLLVIGFVRPLRVVLVPAWFCAFMFALALRNVAYNTLVSKVPRPEERARFQSMQSTVTHIAISIGTAIAGALLTSRPDGSLVGVPNVAWLAISISTLVPFFMWRVERRVLAASA
jgi:predicted MFS family arabinose efflux permease